MAAVLFALGTTLSLLGIRQGQAQASATPKYSITVLGDFEAKAINDSGVIVGREDDEEGGWHALVWKEGELIRLTTTFPPPGEGLPAPNTSGEAINNSGVVAGNSDNGRPFTWNISNATVINPGVGHINSLPAEVSVHGINSEGLMVGSALNPFSSGVEGNGTFPFVFSGLSFRLITEPIDDRFSYQFALAVNEPGVVVGCAQFYSGLDDRKGIARAFQWSGFAVKPLALPDWGWSSASDVNDKGHVVGQCLIGPEELGRGFIWVDGDGSGAPAANEVTFVGTFGGNYSNATKINDKGQVIGYAAGSDGRPIHFLRSPGAAGIMTPLVSLVQGSGWVELEATDINDAGQIVGNGRLIDGRRLAFRMDPECAPAYAGPYSALNDWRIISDFGPRNVIGGKYFHEGIDLAKGGAGEDIPAVESGVIEKIDYQGGYYVRVRGHSTGAAWTYLHIFDSAGFFLGRYLLTVTREGQEYPAGKWLILKFGAANSTDVEAAYVERVVEPGTGRVIPPPVIDWFPGNVKAKDCVDTGEHIAPMGKSGGENGRGVPVHLHLALNMGQDNPFYHLERPASAIQVILQRPKQEQVFTSADEITVSALVSSRDTLDLDKVRLYVDGTEVTPHSTGQHRPAFGYGGRPSEDRTPSSSSPTGEEARITISNVESFVRFRQRPLDADPRTKDADAGLDQFDITGLRANSFEPFVPHRVQVDAIGIDGGVHSATAVFVVVPK